jgi:hypothetical protein
MKLFIQRQIANIKLYGNFSVPQTSKLNKFFINKFIGRNNSQNYVFGHCYPEIFEFKDKSKFISATLISKDISDLTLLDNYKENYPYTVSLMFLCYNLNKFF